MATPVRVLNPREVLVKIKLDGNGNLAVSQDPFRVSISRKEEVLWDCDVDFEVDFASLANSPFGDFTFNQVNPCSGLVRRDVKPGNKFYKYTVKAFGKVLDPDGQVDP